MTAEAGGLFAKVVAASRLITHVPKNGFNAHHKFHFASHDDVSDVCKAAMDEVGLCLIPVRSVAEEVGKLTRVTVTSMLADPDTGQSHLIEWQGEGADAQDKALYKALTQAKKTVLLNLFLIPTGDYEADGDYGHGQAQGKSKPAKAETKPTPRPAAKPEPQKGEPPADPHWSELRKGEQIEYGTRFKDLATAVQWDPDYEDVYHWAEQKKILGFDDAKGRASVSASTRGQIERALDMLAKLGKARPARKLTPGEHHGDGERKPALDRAGLIQGIFEAEARLINGGDGEVWLQSHRVKGTAWHAQTYGPGRGDHFGPIGDLASWTEQQLRNWHKYLSTMAAPL